MADLGGMASGLDPNRALEHARRAWQESMQRRIEALRAALRRRAPQDVAECTAARYVRECLWLGYWGRELAVAWPSLEASYPGDDGLCSTFETAMVLYYLSTADGAPLAGRWIGFRQLPDGGFYHRAFQGYSGDRLAAAFGDSPEDLLKAATSLGGSSFPSLTDFAFRFQPLPRIPLVAVLWPGDAELPARGAVLFDASSSHYMPTDGLALLGSGLIARLTEANPS